MRLLLALVLCLLASPSFAQSGGEIYRLGRGADPIWGLVGRSGSPIPGTAIPCIGCHGSDRKGGQEGGVSVPAITWEALSRPAYAIGAARRNRPAYDRAGLARAIMDGVDSAGRPLDTAMPRYRLSPADLDALVSFLEQESSLPGVDETELAIAVDPGLAGTLERRTIELAIQELNEAGGIHGRRVRLAETGVAAFSIWTPTAEEPSVPQVALFASTAGAGNVGLVPDTTTVAEALALELARSGHPVAVAGGTPDETARVAERVRAEGGTIVHGADRLPGGPLPAPLLWLGDAAHLRVFLEDAWKQGWIPEVRAPFERLGAAMLTFPEELLKRVLVALPLTPSDWRRPGADKYRRFAERHALPVEPRTAVAYAAVQVMAEALRRTGRDVTRERLFDTLRRLGPLDVGSLPPLEIAPGRTSGLTRLYLMRVVPRTGTLAAVGTIPLP